MRDFLKGLGALLFFIMVAGVALAFLPKSQLMTAAAPAQPSPEEAAEAARNARREKLTSDCLGPNATMMAPKYFREALEACDREASREMATDPDPIEAERMAEAYDAAIQADQRAKLEANEATSASVEPAPADPNPDPSQPTT